MSFALFPFRDWPQSEAHRVRSSLGDLPDWMSCDQRTANKLYDASDSVKLPAAAHCQLPHALSCKPLCRSFFFCRWGFPLQCEEFLTAELDQEPVRASQPQLPAGYREFASLALGLLLLLLSADAMKFLPRCGSARRRAKRKGMQDPLRFAEMLVPSK